MHTVDQGRPEGGPIGAIAPPEIFRVSYKNGHFLHKAGLRYLATIGQSLYLTSHKGGIQL